MNNNDHLIIQLKEKSIELYKQLKKYNIADSANNNLGGLTCNQVLEAMSNVFTQRSFQVLLEFESGKPLPPSTKLKKIRTYHPFCSIDWSRYRERTLYHFLNKMRKQNIDVTDQLVVYLNHSKDKQMILGQNLNNSTMEIYLKYVANGTSNSILEISEMDGCADHNASLNGSFKTTDDLPLSDQCKKFIRAAVYYYKGCVLLRHINNHHLSQYLISLGFRSVKNSRNKTSYWWDAERIPTTLDHYL